jgi:hypothetical protein
MSGPVDKGACTAKYLDGGLLAAFNDRQRNVSAWM